MNDKIGKAHLNFSSSDISFKFLTFNLRNKLHFQIKLYDSSFLFSQTYSHFRIGGAFHLAQLGLLATALMMAQFTKDNRNTFLEIIHLQPLMCHHRVSAAIELGNSLHCLYIGLYIRLYPLHPATAKKLPIKGSLGHILNQLKAIKNNASML